MRPRSKQTLSSFIAEQALMRMAIEGNNHRMMQLAPSDRLAIAVDVLGRDRELQTVHREAGIDVPLRSFYRFIEGLQQAARQVHAEMLAGAVGPVFLTPEESAARLRVSTSEVEQLIREGKLKAVQVGDHWRVTTAELAKFAEANPVPRDRRGRFRRRRKPAA